ncbi:MAG: c-type cytochrome [Gemmatimonadota bacterium]
MRSQPQRRLVQALAGMSAMGLLTMVGCASTTVGTPGQTGNAMLLASAGAIPGPAAAAQVEAPTWYGDVQPIVAENCVDCHQPQGKNMGGMVAPMSLMTYEDAKPWARVMALRVESGEMPPWDAHPMHKGTFVGERYIDDADRQKIVEWAEAGAPEGDPSQATVQFASAGEGYTANTSEWWIGEPDLVMAFGKPYVVPDEARDINVGVNVVVPDSHTEPRWIKASEMRAGSKHVHHICGEPFGCIAPGWDPYVYPDGYAMLLPVVDELRLGMHYNKQPGPGTGFEDVSRAAVVFYDEGEEIRHMVRRTALSVGNDFVIPAHHPEFSITHELEFEEDSYILSFTPHMHYRGKRAKYELLHPDGRLELLLYVPEYDFEWQRMYVFEDPPIAPAGSKLLWTPTWDNSADNKYNPDPTRHVPYGAPTEDEMGNGWLDYTPVAPISHIVGRDPIPQDLLEKVTSDLAASAERESVPLIDGQRADPEHVH